MHQKKKKFLPVRTKCVHNKGKLKCHCEDMDGTLEESSHNGWDLGRVLSQYQNFFCSLVENICGAVTVEHQPYGYTYTPTCNCIVLMQMEASTITAFKCS